MNRTKGILLGAALLGVLAMVLALTNDRTTAPPPIPASGNGDVSMQSELSTSHLHRGDGLIHLDIALSGQAKRLKKQRLPLNVALVIDRSGSMAGDKLLHARNAARTVIERLRSGDRVSLVTYGSDVTVLVPSTIINESSRRRILAAIDGIVDRGGTFLSGGLEAGRQEVMRHLAPNQVSRVILISDGQANEGITSNAALTALARETATKGVSVTAMGVGLSFNEDVMTAMAEAGNGYYYFINNTSRMADVFSKELKAMIATVAQRPQLDIHLAPGVSLRKIYGYQYEQSGQHVVVRLPDVFSEQRRKIICQLHVNPASAGSTTQHVANVNLTYTNAETGNQSLVRNTVSVSMTSDPALAARSENKRVMARVAQVEAAAGLSQAMRQYAEGDVAAARKTLQTHRRRTKRAARRLNAPVLDALSGNIALQAEATKAPPSSVDGKRLIKRNKASAYTLSK